jgi:hypothetical protein
MQTFKNLDGAACRELRDLIDTHLAALNEDTNLHFACGNMSYGEGHITAKVEISLREADGTVVTKEAADFKRYAFDGYWDGLTGSNLGDKITINGEVLEIVGAKPRSRKYPILCRKTNGRTYKFPAITVARAIAAA